MKSRLGFAVMLAGCFILAVLVFFLYSRLEENRIRSPEKTQVLPKPLIEKNLVEPEDVQKSIPDKPAVPDLVKVAEESITAPPTPITAENLAENIDNQSGTESDREPIQNKDSATREPEPPVLPAATGPSPKIIPREPQPRPDITAIGVIEEAVGKTTITRGKNRQFPAERGTEIEMNDLISCGKGGRIKMVFQDGTILSMGENSDMVIDEYLFASNNPDDCSVSLRVTRGICRMITGVITRIRPEAFNIRTQMATIGIRGCDVAVKSGKDRLDVYVMNLPSGHQVDVFATIDGRPVVNLATGKEMIIPLQRRDKRTVEEPRRMVSVIRGSGMTARPMTSADIQQIESAVEPLKPLSYQFLPTPDGAILELSPVSEETTE